MTRTCNKCGRTKALDRFNPSARGKDGRETTCRDCRLARKRELARARREAFKAKGLTTNGKPPSSRANTHPEGGGGKDPLRPNPPGRLKLSDVPCRACG